MSRVAPGCDQQSNKGRKIFDNIEVKVKRKQIGMPSPHLPAADAAAGAAAGAGAIKYCGRMEGEKD